MGAKQKALIFTENPPQRKYICKNFLDENGYKGKNLSFNGSNNDSGLQEIY